MQSVARCATTKTTHTTTMTTNKHVHHGDYAAYTAIAHAWAACDTHEAMYPMFELVQYRPDHDQYFLVYWQTYADLTVATKYWVITMVEKHHGSILVHTHKHGVRVVYTPSDKSPAKEALARQLHEERS